MTAHFANVPFTLDNFVSVFNCMRREVGSVRRYCDALSAGAGRSTAFASVAEGPVVLAACAAWKGLFSYAPSFGRGFRWTVA